MRAQFKLLFVCSLFSLILGLAPLHAHAQAALPASDPCVDNRVDGSGNPSASEGSSTAMGSDMQTVTKNLKAWGQDKLKGKMAGMSLVKPINVAADYCLQKLIDLFQMIGDIADSNFSIGGAITKLIVNQIIAQIAAAISHSCAVVASDLSGAFAALQTDATNAFCLPLPALDIQGITSTGIKVPTIPCNGTSLLSVTGPGAWTAPTNASSGVKVYKLFGK